MKTHRYTPEQKEFLKSNVTGVRYKELTAMFNSHFGLTLKESQILSACMRCAFHNGLDARFLPGERRSCASWFKKGRIPHNKGKSYNAGGDSVKTRFRPGHRPQNWCPVGSERVRADGYVYVKIAEPKRWLPKHVHIWEQAHGPRPKGHNVMFGDGDRGNFNLDNLMLVSRADFVQLNKQRLISASAELTRAGLNIVKVTRAVRKAGKGEPACPLTSQP